MQIGHHANPLFLRGSILEIGLQKGKVGPRIDPQARVNVQVSCILSLTRASNLRSVN
jgi:hypothetical protein